MSLGQLMGRFLTEKNQEWVQVLRANYEDVVLWVLGRSLRFFFRLAPVIIIGY